VCGYTKIGSEALLACKSCRYRHCSKGGGPQTLLGAPAAFFGSCRCSFLGSYLLQLLFQSTCVTEISSKAPQQQQQQQQEAGKDARHPLCLACDTHEVMQDPTSQCMLHMLQSRGFVNFPSIYACKNHNMNCWSYIIQCIMQL